MSEQNSKQIFEIKEAYDHVEEIRELFTEYTEGLPFDVGYQNYEDEFQSLPGKYAPPEGRLYLAYAGGSPAGCIALRRLDDKRCEMKRLYIRPAYRRMGLARLLAETILADARSIGYDCMLLDSHDTMPGARALYESLGFVEIPPYNECPIPGTHFYALSF